MCVTGEALIESGETYKQMAEIKYSLEDNVKQNFIEPLSLIQSKDLKEVNVSAFNFYNWKFTVNVVA